MLSERGATGFLQGLTRRHTHLAALLDLHRSGAAGAVGFNRIHEDTSLYLIYTCIYIYAWYTYIYIYTINIYIYTLYIYAWYIYIFISIYIYIEPAKWNCKPRNITWLGRTVFLKLNCPDSDFSIFSGWQSHGYTCYAWWLPFYFHSS